MASHDDEQNNVRIDLGDWRTYINICLALVRNLVE